MSGRPDGRVSKAEILERMREERAYWEELLGRVGEERMTAPGVDGDWSVKDLIAHVAAYEQWTAEQIKSALTGEPAPPVNDDPEHEADWLDMNKRNARIYVLNRDVPLDEIVERGRRAHQQMVEAVEMLSEEELAGPQEWTFGDPVWRLIPEQTYVHYGDHIPAIEEWLDEHGG